MTDAKREISLRPARRAELEELTELSFRSKAVWGYDDAFMAAARDEMTIRIGEFETDEFMVAEVAGITVGFAQISIEGEEAELARLYVDPAKLRNGAGRALFAWACATARQHGAKCIIIDSDPHAADFYRRMGARDIGLAPSGSIPGRMLPMLAYELTKP